MRDALLFDVTWIVPCLFTYERVGIADDPQWARAPRSPIDNTVFGRPPLNPARAVLSCVPLRSEVKVYLCRVVVVLLFCLCL